MKKEIVKKPRVLFGRSKSKTDIVFCTAEYTLKGEADDADIQKIPEESDVAWNE